MQIHKRNVSVSSLPPPCRLSPARSSRGGRGLAAACWCTALWSGVCPSHPRMPGVCPETAVDPSHCPCRTISSRLWPSVSAISITPLWVEVLSTSLHGMVGTGFDTTTGSSILLFLITRVTHYLVSILSLVKLLSTRPEKKLANILDFSLLTTLEKASTA